MSGDDRIDRKLAKQLLAVWLCNYHRAMLSDTEIRFKSANELTEEEGAVYEFAVEAATTALFTKVPRP